MKKGRLEAFSDGVIAILITIMVLELHAPAGVTFQALQPIIPIFMAYVLSFVFVGIYWANHHHLLMLCESVNGAILWANLHLLFWLSLIPFATAWMGEHLFEPTPTALYGVVLFCCGIAYTILEHALMREQGANSRLAAAVGLDRKGMVSSVMNLIAIPIAFYKPAISLALYAAVDLLWLVPDTRIEKILRNA
jgi:uncharacterized membrane protein